MSTLTDAYPSRIADRPATIERQDPVLYGSPEGGPLSAEQASFYRDNGFLFVERLFSAAEVQGMQAQLDRVFKKCSGSSSPEVVLEPDGDEVRSVFAIHRDDAFFRGLTRDPRLVRIAQQLLGSEVYVHQSRINFKPGFGGNGFYWHSDFETWHVEDGMPRMRAVSCSIALSDNHVWNGALMVVPGSHKYFVACVGKTPEDHYTQSLRNQEIGVPDPGSLKWLVDRGGIAMPTGPAGSVLLFDCNTMHGSGNNISPEARSNLFLVYNSVENELVDPYCGLKPRPEFIGHRLDKI